MHNKRGAIFSSLLGRENIVTDLGVYFILYARFHHPFIFKKPDKNNGANTRKNSYSMLSNEKTIFSRICGTLLVNNMSKAQVQ